MAVCPEAITGEGAWGNDCPQRRQPGKNSGNRINLQSVTPWFKQLARQRKNREMRAKTALERTVGVP
jgi:hypothetical protein